MTPLLRTEHAPPDRLLRLAVAGELFAVVDACDRPDVPPAAWERGARACSLYAGTPDAELWAVAPYLFAADAELLAWIGETRATDAWGIWVVAECGLEALARHLRTRLVVPGPDGEALHFRFYDPRVLPPHVDGCTDDELHALFGPARALGAPDEGGARLLHRASLPRRIRLVRDA